MVYTGTAELEIFIVAADRSVAVVEFEDGDEFKKVTGARCTGVVQGGPASALVSSRQRPSLLDQQPSGLAPNAFSCATESPPLVGSSRQKRRRHPRDPPFPSSHTVSDTRVATSLEISTLPALPPARAAATMLHSRTTSTYHATTIASVTHSAFSATATVQ
jgi:hypothetical protein